MKNKFVMTSLGLVLILAIISVVAYFIHTNKIEKAQKKTADQWISLLEKKNFEKLPQIVTNESKKSQGYSDEKLIEKYTNIFTGIGVDKVTISNIEQKENTLTYQMKLHTSIGDTTSFHYKTKILKEGEKYKIDWHPSLIFPNMKASDKISFTSTSAKRGNIIDASGMELATSADAYQAGIIPKDLGTGNTRDSTIKAISSYLDIPIDTIEANLSKGWVQDDLFVPLKTLPDESVKKMTGLQYKAVETRYYPLGEAAANLIGYTGKVTAEDIKKTPSLTPDTTIGKMGLERTYDQELRGTDGGKISLTDESGKVKDVLLHSEVEDGQTIQVTIDSLLQKRAYAALDDATGSTVIMQPKTGALLTLVTKPSFDPNLMVRGISQSEYDNYANNPNKPFTSRYAQRYAPGSTLKAITAAVAFDVGTLKENTVRKIDGLQWQKDSSWGNYKITRVTDNAEVDYQKALIYSDNIFFAQEGLELGEKKLRAGFTKFGFEQAYDLPFSMDVAQISSDKTFDNDILLADTAYGQGQLLMSPIHQAVAYSAFANDGKIVSPHLIFKEKSKTTQAASTEAVEKVNKALLQVVSNKNGTAHLLNSNSSSLAAKTGTAELKSAQGTTGQENSFLMAFDTEKENYIFLSLVENHKETGKTATELAAKLIPELAKLNYSEK
ncbi:MAG: penicillin-binding protein [Kurthia sp.]|nr:penicillin-binding protein [Candidatus Kurthia equi]